MRRLALPGGAHLNVWGFVQPERRTPEREQYDIPLAYLQGKLFGYEV
jgi:hypothetical protein